MASFQHPFQCVQYVRQQSADSAGFLVASAGRKLYSYAIANGQCLDAWPKNTESSSKSVSDAQNQESEGKSLPKKNKHNELPDWTNIPILLTSFDGKHVVALTAEDKCIRVFSLSEEGKLDELSARTMQKRPSALALTPDGQTILCGDKFGDAYSLPLIPGAYTRPVEEEKAYKPAATNLTVHSGRNLISLEQQMKEAERAVQNPGNSSEEKTALNFEHQQILGHVSMLTDLISFSLPTGASGSRSYIMTADRDEHIRVSRGLPQAHVIEKYCLGHTSFISQLCVPSWAPQYLVSGGGDDFLLLWNWQEGQVLQKVPLPVSKGSESSVRGIWAISLNQSAGPPVQVILVGLEGSSILLCYSIEGNTLNHIDTVKLSGNILDLTCVDSQGSIVVSVDNVREPTSTDAWRANPEAAQTLLDSFKLTTEDGRFMWELAEDALVAPINAAGTSAIPSDIDIKQKKALDGVIYNVGVLRKRQFDE